jgi:hypothetical protein
MQAVAEESYIKDLVNEWLDRTEHIAPSISNITLKDTRVRMF